MTGTNNFKFSKKFLFGSKDYAVLSMPNKYFLFVAFIFLFLMSSLSFAEVEVNDVSRLNPTKMEEIYIVKDEVGLKRKLIEAKSKGLKISIGGKQHSQGGHQFVENGILLDMRQFNKILGLNEKEKILTVQSGVTWAQIQEYANKFNLAVKVMQSSNIFTVGGSLGLNIHGRDPNQGPIRETVKSFRIMLADGSVVNASREENAELFNLVIGGMGLFGIILDVNLELTDNVALEKSAEVMDYKEYPEFFKRKIKNHQEVALHSAALSIVPGRKFLRELILTTHYRSIKSGQEVSLQKEKYVQMRKFLFGLSRKYAWGKAFRWSIQSYCELSDQGKVFSRNNAMRPPIEFLDYYSKDNTDILQEYFVPIKNFIPFVDGLRVILKKQGVNLTHLRIRYVPQDAESLLAYATQDSLALVLYVNVGLSPGAQNQVQEWTRDIVDLAINQGGTYYLAYQKYPTKEQSRKAYPHMDTFFHKKRDIDPGLFFMNEFYHVYE